MSLCVDLMYMVCILYSAQCVNKSSDAETKEQLIQIVCILNGTNQQQQQKTARRLFACFVVAVAVVSNAIYINVFKI